VRVKAQGRKKVRAPTTKGVFDWRAWRERKEGKWKTPRISRPTKKRKMGTR